MNRVRTGRWVVWVLITLGAGSTALAAVGSAVPQERGRRSTPGGGYGVDPAANNPPYDGRFTFVRIRFTPTAGRFFGRRSREPAWHHDYPTGERNLANIVRSLSMVDVNASPANGAGVVLDLTDPDLFRYPWAYLCEPGYWDPTEEEAAALRAYLRKGGFIVFDDFVQDDWYNFQQQIQRVLPGAQIHELDPSHPIFQSFFEIESLEFTHPNYWYVRPVFYGIYEENDPQKRLVAVINYNNDIGDYWEWSDTGWVPIALSNEAYKFGVNYIIYGITH